MAYSLPQFNLQVNVWRWGSDVANPPDVSTFGNLTGMSNEAVMHSSPVANGVTGNERQYKLHIVPMRLLVPKLEDVRPPSGVDGEWGDCIECPAGSGRFYAALQVDDIGKGFQNEHRCLLMIPLTGIVGTQLILSGWNLMPYDWPFPIP